MTECVRLSSELRKVRSRNRLRGHSRSSRHSAFTAKRSRNRRVEVLDTVWQCFYCQKRKKNSDSPASRSFELAKLANWSQTLCDVVKNETTNAPRVHSTTVAASHITTLQNDGNHDGVTTWWHPWRQYKHQKTHRTLLQYQCISDTCTRIYA